MKVNEQWQSENWERTREDCGKKEKWEMCAMRKRMEVNFHKYSLYKIPNFIQYGRKLWI